MSFVLALVRGDTVTSPTVWAEGATLHRVPVPWWLPDGAEERRQTRNRKEACKCRRSALAELTGNAETLDWEVGDKSQRGNSESNDEPARKR